MYHTTTALLQTTPTPTATAAAAAAVTRLVHAVMY